MKSECHVWLSSLLIILYFAINYVIFNVPIGNCLRQWIGAAGSEVSPSREPALDGRLLCNLVSSNKYVTIYNSLIYSLNEYISMATKVNIESCLANSVKVFV